MKYIKKYNESREEITSDEGREFLNIIRQKIPNELNKYMSLIGNKGLDIAKKHYELNDPDEIKRKEKEKEKIEKQNFLKKKKENRLTDYYLDMLISKYLKTDDWKEWIANTGYPDIGYYPSHFKFNISSKKEEYSIYYDNETKKIISSLGIFIYHSNDSTTIEAKYIVKFDFFKGILFNFIFEKTFKNKTLEECIIEFLTSFKESIYEKEAIIVKDINKVRELGQILENEKFIKKISKSEGLNEISIYRKNFSDYLSSKNNTDINFLSKIPLSKYYYNGEYIIINILNDEFIIKFHEQYAFKVYNIFKKLKAS